MKQIILIVLTVGLVCAFRISDPTPIDVTDQTLKIGGMKEEVLYFGFAEGDQIVFNFSEVNGKELKEVEILEYPSTSKFSDYKTAKIENKILNVNKKAIYKFRFYNSAIVGRICKIKIQRIPASDETKNFVSNVNWITKQDTTWNTYTKDIIVGYDTTFRDKKKKELIKTDTIVTGLIDRVEKVHSFFNNNSQFSNVNVTLPNNSYLPNRFDAYETTEVLAWSYWIGVIENSDAQQQYENANKNLGTAIKGVAAFSGYGALAELAISGISLFTPPKNGENVKYWITANINGVTNTYESGDVISANGRNDKIKQGSFTIKLYNDNPKLGINVSTKVLCVQVKKTYEDKVYTETISKPRYEKKIFKDPIIATTKVPVIGQ